MRGCTTKKGVLILDHDGEVPEGGIITLSHGEKVTKGVLFPILGEVIN